MFCLLQKFVLMNPYLLLLVFLSIFTYGNSVSSLNIGFYYSNNDEEILLFNYDFYSNQELLKLQITNNTEEITLSNAQTKFSSKDLLTEENKIKDYTSKAIDGTFDIKYHSIFLNKKEIYLIKISYNASSTLFSEIIFEIPSEDKKVEWISYPNKLLSDFSVGQCPECSKKGKERLKKTISDIYGFYFESPENLKGEIEKVFLISKKDDQIVYYADMTSIKYLYNDTTIDIHNYQPQRQYYDFYLEDMPETFELHITFNIKEDLNNELTGRKILLVKKNINHPNFGIDNNNPNFSMFIISVSVIGVSLIATIFGIVVKNILF